MNFANIEIVLDVQETNKGNLNKLTKLNDRYVIGYDPCESDEELLEKGLNTFTIYDKFLQRFILKSTTRKTFDEFCSSILDRDDFKKSYIISNKFIENGRPKRRDSIRTQA